MSFKRNLPAPRGSASIHLDALRGLAAFLVLFCHWRDAFFVDYVSLAGHNLLSSAFYLLSGMGHQWVIVFFVLSGYLVGGSVLRAFHDLSWSWRSYLLTRVTRLYVVLLPALLLGGLADWFGMRCPGSGSLYAGLSGMRSLTSDVHLTLTRKVFLENLVFLQNLHANNFGSNTVLWSLANEFWYYLAFPLLVMACGRRQRLLIRAVCVLALIAWGLFAGAHVVLFAIPWLLGVLIAKLPACPASVQWRRLAVLGAAGFFAAGMICFSVGEVFEGAGHRPLFGLLEGVPVTDLLLSVPVFLLIWVKVHCATDTVPVVYAWIAKRAASSSYTLYLVHFPFLVLLKAAFALPRAVPAWKPALLSTAVLLACVAYAQLMYELFERNTLSVRRWLESFVSGTQPLTGALLISKVQEGVETR